MDQSVELLGVATELARRAAAVLRLRPSDLQATSKSTPTDAVTVMDKAAERLILDGLLEMRPGDAVVSEESGERAGTGVVTWVVDPLDGTVNYLYSLPHYSVSIAAEIDGSAVCGVVLDVERDRLFAATRDGGATCNGEAIRCTAEAELAQALIATGFGYSAERRTRQASVLRELLPRVRDIRRQGSAALDLCAVASGHVDGYFESGMQHWDWAAGALIAQEAGARVEMLHPTAADGPVVVAANPALFASLHDLLLAAEAGGGAPAS